MEWIDAVVAFPNESERMLLLTTYPVFSDDYAGLFLSVYRHH
jgi:hypothetical protein